MPLLTSTSDVLQVVTGVAGMSLKVHASYFDNNAGTITPDRKNTPTITTATTTPIVASPGSSVQRNAKEIHLVNQPSGAAGPVTVQHTDGTNVEDLFGPVTMLPGESVRLDKQGNWHHCDASGAEYSYTGGATANLGATGVIAETMPRETCPEVNTTIGATGVLNMQAIYLKAGQIVSNIEMWSATTAAGTPTHWLFGLFDASRNLLATSADQTTTAWAANTKKKLAMTTPYRVPTSGLYYIGMFMTATTMITAKGGTAKTGGQMAGDAPILNGTSSTGLTTAMPNPAAAITAGTASIYAAVS